MVDFHEVRFPDTISRGSSGGPRRRTDIVTLRSGYEERNSIWADSRREYDAGLGIRDVDDLYAVLEFFEARAGRLYGFRWKDWADYKTESPSSSILSITQVIGTGDGTETQFQLSKSYVSGGVTYERIIKKPVMGTVRIVHGSQVMLPNDPAINYETGVVTFNTAPAAGVVIRAGFEFDVPVRFKDDYIDITIDLFSAGQVPQVNVIEVKV